jgi:HEAT repeat protein
MTALMALLRNDKPHVKALARRGDTDGLIDAVFYQDHRGGGRAGDPRALGAPVREEAVKALAAVGPEHGRLAVIDALIDSSDLVRSAAVEVLAGWGEVLPLADALAWLPPGRGRSRRLALRAVEQLAGAGAACAVARALVHAVDEGPMRPDEARLVVTLLGAEEHPGATEETVETLVAALDDKRAVVGDRAATLLTDLGPASIGVLTGALSGERARPGAASVLGRIGDLSALGPLVEALEHPDPRVRSESCLALGELRDPFAAEPLLRAAGDPEPTVRASAGSALDRIGTAGVLAALAALAALIPGAVDNAVDAAIREREPTKRPLRAVDTQLSGRPNATPALRSRRS